MAIKYEQIITGMVVCRELDITIIKLYGSWNVQKSGNYVQGFDRLKDAKAFVAEKVAA
jgi:hypothetical protein